MFRKVRGSCHGHSSQWAPWVGKRCTQGALRNLSHKSALHIRNKVYIYIYDENSYTLYIYIYQNISVNNMRVEL